LLKGIFDHIDENGRVRLEDLVDYFIDYYEGRRYGFMKKSRDVEYFA